MGWSLLKTIFRLLFVRDFHGPSSFFRLWLALERPLEITGRFLKKSRSPRLPGHRDGSDGNRSFLPFFRPAIDVCIWRAIGSANRQTCANWALLIVDDGSVDDTAAWLAAIDNPKMHIPGPEARSVERSRLAPGIGMVGLGLKDRAGNSRPNEPGGSATKPPNGSAALCGVGRSDLRNSRRAASAARLVIPGGIDPLRLFAPIA